MSFTSPCTGARTRHLRSYLYRRTKITPQNSRGAGPEGSSSRPQHVLENHGHLVDNHDLPLSTTDPSNKVLREELRQLVRHE